MLALILVLIDSLTSLGHGQKLCEVSSQSTVSPSYRISEKLWIQQEFWLHVQCDLDTLPIHFVPRGT